MPAEFAQTGKKDLRIDGIFSHKGYLNADYLISRGIPGSRFRTVSYGKERPVAVCNDISCWSQNRRAVTLLDGAPTS